MSIDNANIGLNDVLNFKPRDAFKEALNAHNDGSVSSGDGFVHLRMQQRNARQKISTVEGLDQRLNFAKILKCLKKTLCCNGIVVKDELLGQILQLQGDHRAAIAQFLLDEELVLSRDLIKIHGSK